MSTARPSGPSNSKRSAGRLGMRSSGMDIFAVVYVSPVAERQALLNGAAMDRGRYVSVVPLSTITPLPELYLAWGMPRDLPATLMSSSLTVNHPTRLVMRVNLGGAVTVEASKPPRCMLPPPTLKHSEKVRSATTPACTSCGTSVPVCADMPIMPSASCVRKSPVSLVWHPNVKSTARAEPFTSPTDSPPIQNLSVTLYAIHDEPSE
mmetsp:Transcript_19946/g.67571  ORF Transcript_19946/g.67571 Transcript_19946/m.67571 type:complete len:207 (+) Transcript_19946:249-869(+)